MFTSRSSTYARSVAIALASLVAVMGNSSQAQPAQKPLLSFDGGGVKPNIMLTMDDSGSMTWQHMPEITIYVGSHTIENPVGSNGTKSDPGDISTTVNFIGTVAGQPGSTNYRQMLMRSPDTNTVYYNPEVRYLPWAIATYPLPAASGINPAGRMANSPVAAAYRVPTDPSGGGTVDLTNIRSVNTKWCYRDDKKDCSNANESYDPGLYYRLKKDASGNFLDPSKAANYTEFTVNAASSTTYTKYANRLDCQGASVCTRDEERQNFANWFTYYRSRNLMARGAISESFADAADIFRLGWGRINNSTSQSIDGFNTKVIENGVRDFNSTTKAALYSWLQALPASGSTPLPGALQAVGNYFSDSGSKGPWADSPGVGSDDGQKSCRRAYNIMVTDGYWNVAGNPKVGNVDNTKGTKITGPSGAEFTYLPINPYKDDKSNMLADYAMYYWNRDLRTDLVNNVKSSPNDPAFWQHLTNFTVGLGVRGTLNPLTDLPALTLGAEKWGSDEIDDLWHAALNSRGTFFSAKDPIELSKSVRSAVDQASADAFKEGGVATASTILQDNNRKYIPQYKYGTWAGDVIAYTLDKNGVPGPQAWSAQSKLPTAAKRNIVTWNPDASAASLFSWDTIGSSNQSALGTLTTVPSSTGEDLVNFLRGDQSKEGDGKSFRQRVSPLGDFVNSNPVLVAGSVNMGYGTLPSNQGGADTRYDTFVKAKAARTATLFVGANDGMLHAFKDTLTNATTDGTEVFAYVPKSVYGNLSKLANKNYGTTALYHQYFVDGPLVEVDAFVNAPDATQASWRNYLLGSLGGGGRAVFALDVTNAPNLNSTAVRWEINFDTYPDLGYVLAPIEVGVLPNGEWVAVFGNGRFSTGGVAALFVVNLQTGAVASLRVDTSGNNGLGGVGVVRNGYGQITNLYAGSMNGNLWRFDYSASADSRFVVAGGQSLFVAAHTDGVPQAITQAPVIYDHSKGGKLVVFGTGRLSSLSDVSPLPTQAIYGVWDKPSDTVTLPMSRSLLKSRELSTTPGADGTTYYRLAGDAVDWDGGQRGWVINLDLPVGMQVIYPPQKLTSSIAMVSAVKPADSSDVCSSATGTGINLLIPVETGLNPTYPFFDVNGDSAINSSDTIVAGYGTNADGIDAVVIGTPVCSGSTCNTKISIQNTTGYKTGNLQGPNNSSASRQIKDRVWRRIINPPIR